MLATLENVPVIHYKEPPVDYDHPNFYLFVGTVLGIIATFFFRMLTIADQSNIKYVQLIIAIYLIGVGLFLVFSQPVRGRYGKKSGIYDLVFGCLLLIASLIFLFA